MDFFVVVMFLAIMAVAFGASALPGLARSLFLCFMISLLVWTTYSYAFYLGSVS